ncbi:hypothetical protein A2U01_0010956, partial [Trifolium medium]|nr:hypothetical protein [Trifolium medium]
TRRRQSTLAHSYLVRDREVSDIVAPKKYGYGDLLYYVSIEAEEVQNLVSNIFWETIRNKDKQTLRLVELLEVVGCKESSILQLVKLPQNPKGYPKNSRIVRGKQFFRRTGRNNPGPKILWWKLVELPKISMIIGYKNFKRVEGIMRVEEVKVNLLGLAMVVGSKCRLVSRIEVQGWRESNVEM